MKKNDLDEKIATIVADDGRYPADAYHFISHAVIITASQEGRASRHVSALEVLRGLQVVARESFGAFAAQVLKEWNISGPEDIGIIIFQLVDAKILSSSKNDSQADFSIDFDLFAGLEILEEDLPEINQIEVPIID